MSRKIPFKIEFLLSSSGGRKVPDLHLTHCIDNKRQVNFSTMVLYIIYRVVKSIYKTFLYK